MSGLEFMSHAPVTGVEAARPMTASRPSHAVGHVVQAMGMGRDAGAEAAEGGWGAGLVGVAADDAEEVFTVSYEEVSSHRRPRREELYFSLDVYGRGVFHRDPPAWFLSVCLSGPRRRGVSYDGVTGGCRRGIFLGGNAQESHIHTILHRLRVQPCGHSGGPMSTSRFRPL